jgi:alpha-galactosidase/6-phospho-beta-glucosidase family protein
MSRPVKSVTRSLLRKNHPKLSQSLGYGLHITHTKSKSAMLTAYQRCKKSKLIAIFLTSKQPMLECVYMLHEQEPHSIGQEPQQQQLAKDKLPTRNQQKKAEQRKQKAKEIDKQAKRGQIGQPRGEKGPRAVMNESTMQQLGGVDRMPNKRNLRVRKRY